MEKEKIKCPSCGEVMEETEHFWSIPSYTWKCPNGKCQKRQKTKGEI